MRNRSLQVWLFALMGLVVTACGYNQSGTAGSSPLDGRTFISQEVKGRTLAESTEIRVTFDQGTVSFNAGCNHLSGNLDSTGNSVLTVSSVGGTEMGCDAARHDQDAWLAEFFTSGPRWSLDGNRLTLSDANTEIVLLDRVEADPDRALEGTRWLVTAISSGPGPDDSVSSVDPEYDAFITFTNGGFEGNNGCNSMTGSYRVNEDSLAITAIERTAGACVDDARAQLEQSVVDVLKGRLSYRIEADRLTLRSSSGRGLILHADE